MSLLLPCRKKNPCPVCGDKKGKCQICEYGYLCVCESRLDVKVGDFVGTWRCKEPLGDDAFLWKDQRVVFETQFTVIKNPVFVKRIFLESCSICQINGKVSRIEDARFCVFSSRRGKIAHQVTFQEAQKIAQLDAREDEV